MTTYKTKLTGHLEGSVLNNTKWRFIKAIAEGIRKTSQGIWHRDLAWPADWLTFQLVILHQFIMAQGREVLGVMGHWDVQAQATKARQVYT